MAAPRGYRQSGPAGCARQHIGSHLRRLDRVQLVQLLDYERAHADRVGIVLLLENRLAKLIAAPEQEPS